MLLYSQKLRANVSLMILTKKGLGKLKFGIATAVENMVVSRFVISWAQKIHKASPVRFDHQTEIYVHMA